MPLQDANLTPSIGGFGFRHSGSIAGKSVISANAANSLVDRFPKALWGFSSL